MAKRKTAGRTNRSLDANLSPVGADESPETAQYIVTFRDDAGAPSPTAMSRALSSVAGTMRSAVASDFEGSAVNMAEADEADSLLLENLGIAIVRGDMTRSRAMSAAAADPDSRILAVEPVSIKYAIGLSRDYLRGFRDAAQRLLKEHDGAEEGVPGVEEPGEISASAAEAAGAAPFTWGVNAVGAPSSQATGEGVRVAILDTGFDLDHPDFVGRMIQSQSFIPNQHVNDRNGHGTHCTGTACGPLAPSTGTRYGVAHRAQIFIGKVLSNQGSGADPGILAGINWAVQNGCQVISMSLGSLQGPVVAYEQAGQKALNAGCLIIAAAGNNAKRPANPGIVENPANCQSIMAVAAIDRNLKIASFSARSRTQAGGKVDISGPGVRVFSSTPHNPAATPQPPTFHVIKERYDFMNGTSMATPHVAGVAALWCEKTGARGAALYQKLVSSARPLSEPTVDCGVGLVQSPQ